MSFSWLGTNNNKSNPKNRVCQLLSCFLPVSSAETWQLLHQLTSKGLAPAEAVEQVALVNYISPDESIWMPDK